MAQQQQEQNPNRESSKNKSVSKFLLEFLSRNLSGDPTELYKNYLHRCWSGYLNLAELAESDPEVIKDFYKYDSPKEEPTFFSLFKASFLARLEPLTGKRLCVYWDRKDGQVERIYDSTILDEAFPRGEPLDRVVFVLENLKGDDWAIEAFENPKPEELFGGRAWVDLEFSLREVRIGQKGERITGLGKIKDGCCIFEEVARCLGYPEWRHSEHQECSTIEELSFRAKEDLRKEFFTDFILVTHLRTNLSGRRHSQRDREFFVLVEVLENPDVADLDCPVICFGKGRDLYSLEGKNSAKVLLDRSSRRPLTDPSTVNSWSPFSAHAGRPTGRVSLCVGRPDGGPAKKSRSQRKSENVEFAKSLFRSEEEEEEGGAHYADSCDCFGCRDCPEHGLNMNLNGPQSLYKTEPSTEDYLNAFNLNNDFYSGIIDEVQRACISVFDVEACTKNFDPDVVRGDFFVNRPVSSGARVPTAPQAVQLPIMIGYADIMNTESKNFMSPPWPRIRRSAIFALENLRQQQRMVTSFMSHVERQKATLSKMKESLLKPFFEKLEEAKRQHVEFFRLKGYIPQDSDPFHIIENSLGKFLDDCEEEEEEEEEGKRQKDDDDDLHDPRFPTRKAVMKLYSKHKERSDEGPPLLRPGRHDKIDELYEGEEDDLEAFERASPRCTTLPEDPKLLEKSMLYLNSLYVVEAWQNRLEGRFEKRLKALVNTHLVFGFNAEGYDLPILASKIIMSCKQRSINKQIRMTKNGNRISRLSIGSLIFLEASKLTGPGMSLDKLGKSCNLKVEKGIFPFDELHGPEYLKNTSLPKARALWRNRLNPEKTPSRADVNKAIALFRKKRFQNVGEYMQFYLHKDCKILLESLLLYHDGYKKLLGLSFVDSRKFTVSSLSATGVQTYLMRNKRIGHFFCNNVQMYSILKRGLRGGLTFVGRTVGGKDADYEPFTEEAEKFVQASGSDLVEEASKQVERLRTSKDFCSCTGRSRKRIPKGMKKRTFSDDDDDDEDLGKKSPPPWARINAHLLKGRCRTCGKPILLTPKEASLKERLKAFRIKRGSSERPDQQTKKNPPNRDLRNKRRVSSSSSSSSIPNKSLGIGKKETILDLLEEFASEEEDEITPTKSPKKKIDFEVPEEDVDPGEPNYVIYLDVASLYASSCKPTSFLHLTLHLTFRKSVCQKLRTLEEEEEE